LDQSDINFATCSFLLCRLKYSLRTEPPERTAHLDHRGRRAKMARYLAFSISSCFTDGTFWIKAILTLHRVHLLYRLKHSQNGVAGKDGASGPPGSPGKDGEVSCSLGIELFCFVALSDQDLNVALFPLAPIFTLSHVPLH
jgi:hypothetical protein